MKRRLLYRGKANISLLTSDEEARSSPPVQQPTPRLSRRMALASPLMAGLFSRPGHAQSLPSTPRPRSIPARLLPVPGSVSPALQRRIAAPYPVGWDTVP